MFYLIIPEIKLEFDTLEELLEYAKTVDGNYYLDCEDTPQPETCTCKGFHTKC
jgi:hypothetical protein